MQLLLVTNGAFLIKSVIYNIEETREEDYVFVTNK